MEKEECLSAAAIRCLHAISRLDRNDGGVRSVDAALALGITKPSVHALIKALCEKGYLEMVRYGTVHLTAAGRQSAGCYAACCHLLTRQFAHSLQLPDRICQRTAGAVLAQIPVDRLAEVTVRLTDREKGQLNNDEDNS